MSKRPLIASAAGYRSNRRVAWRVIGACLVLACFALPLPAAEPVTKTVLPNGLTVLVKPEPGSGVVALDGFVHAGQPQERPPLAGIGNLVARTLMTSTLNNSADRLASAIDEVGGNFQAVWNADFTELRAVTTSANFEEAARLIGEILSNATFPEKALEEARKAVLEEIRSSGDSAFEDAYRNLVEMLYRDNPYQRALAGDVLAVRKLTREDALVFYHQYFVPNNTVLAIVGDVTAEQAVEAARVAFSGARPAALPKRHPIPDEELGDVKSRVLQRDISAAYVLVGYLVPGMSSSEYPALTIASMLLGGGKASRLFTRIRDEQAIGYDIGTLYPWRANQSHLVLYVSVDARRFDVVSSIGGLGIEDLRKLLVEQVEALRAGDFSDLELGRAKSYAEGSWLLRRQRVADRAFFLGSLESIGLGYQFDANFGSKIEAVTKADVQKVCKKYLKDYAVVVVVPNSSDGEKVD